MKKNRGKFFLIIATFLLSLYFIYPTYKDYRLTHELRGLSGEDSLKFVEEKDSEMRDAKQKRIKLGLDLQGGMRVVLEVNVLKLLEDIAKNKDEIYHAVMAEVKATG